MALAPHTVVRPKRRGCHCHVAMAAHAADITPPKLRYVDITTCIALHRHLSGLTSNKYHLLRLAPTYDDAGGDDAYYQCRAGRCHTQILALLRRLYEYQSIAHGITAPVKHASPFLIIGKTLCELALCDDVILRGSLTGCIS